jgi:ribosome recycling factor
MNEDVKFIIDSTKEQMQSSIKHLEQELTNIRAGKASPIMLKSVMVDYYGTSTPLSQVANVSTLDAHTITVQPWEKTLIPEIEKGIMVANLGLNPMNNGESVIINVPILTEERRKELAKQAKSETEDAKVSIRNDRKEANSELKSLDISEDLLKNAEIDIQELTNKFSIIADEHFAVKEKEIMKV